MQKSGCNKLKLRVRVRPRNGGISLFQRFLKMGASTADCTWQRAESIPELLNRFNSTRRFSADRSHFCPAPLGGVAYSVHAGGCRTHSFLSNEAGSRSSG